MLFPVISMNKDCKFLFVDVLFGHRRVEKRQCL